MSNLKLTALPLGSILPEDEYLKNALAKEVRYLLALEEGRFLAGFYENAGLKTSYVRYGGWEGMLIAGHAAGHYLSALAQGVANRGVSEEDRARLQAKLVRMVDGLAECEAHSKGKAGFLWAAPRTREGGVEAQFDHVEAGKTNIITQAWVPWYTMHKLLAGLIDCCTLAHYAPALAVARALGDWVAERALGWSEETRARVLSVEYGGMNDCMYALFSLTGDERHARAAHVFDEEPLFDRILTEGKDVLKDRHANTTIPKILGALGRYVCLHGALLGGERVDAARYLHVAEAFFRMVVERHTYVTGGNSEWEHFGADGVLNAERTNCNCETCNVYNMLKLARLLFCVTGDKRYTDYYDNAFTNSILSSQNPETGMTTYFQPMAGGFFKVFSRPFDKFWCCTGSGMENFTKAGDSAIYARGTDLYLEQYLSMHAVYRESAMRVRCGFPLSDRAEIAVERAAQPFTLFLRIPDWAEGEMEVCLNGAPAECRAEAGHLAVRVACGDVLNVRIPVGVRLKGLPDADDVFAFTYGGAVLSADLGTEDMREAETGVEVNIPARRIMPSERIYFADIADVKAHPARYLVREGDGFVLRGGDISYRFGLHYRRYRERYAIYFSLHGGAREAEEVRREPIDTVQPGYGQYETDALHELREENSVSVTAEGICRYAKAGGWFSYDLRVDPTKKNVLSLQFLHADNHKPLRILAGEEKIFAGGIVDTMHEGEAYRREFALPESALRAARKKRVGGEDVFVLRVRFSGLDDRPSVRICEFIYVYAEEK